MFVKGDKKEQLTPVQFYLDRDLSLRDNERTCSVLTSVKLTGIEALQGEARVAYRAVYKVIYRNESGFEAFEDSFEHTVTVKSASITPKSYLDINLAVIACEYVGTTNLKVRATIEINGFVIVPVGFETYDCESNLLCKRSTVEVESIEPIKESEIIVESVEEIKEPIDKLLTYDTQICIKSVSTATEICEIKGECFTYVCFVSEGNITSKCINTPFEAEILAPSVRGGEQAYLSGEVKSTAITLAEGEHGIEVKTEIVVGVKGFAVSREQAEIVTDAYSKDKVLELNFGRAVVEDNVCVTDAYEKLSGSVVPDDDGGVLGVLCVGCPSAGANSVSNVGGLTVEGIVSSEILYLDAEENPAKLLAELPYRVAVSGDFKCKSNLFARTVVTSLTARVRRNEAIELSGEICIEVYGSSDKEIVYLESVTELGAREASNVAISLYIAQSGETLFDVAKELVSDEEELLALNPDLELPLKGGEKILLYRQI